MVWIDFEQERVGGKKALIRTFCTGIWNISSFFFNRTFKCSLSEFGETLLMAVFTSVEFGGLRLFDAVTLPFNHVFGSKDPNFSICRHKIFIHLIFSFLMLSSRKNWNGRGWKFSFYFYAQAKNTYSYGYTVHYGMDRSWFFWPGTGYRIIRNPKARYPAKIETFLSESFLTFTITLFSRLLASRMEFKAIL